MRPLLDRFVEKIELAPDGCWNWTGATAEGYGRISRGGRGQGLLVAHRVAYECLVGTIPDGLMLDHLCRNTRCVNPSHLEPVTNRENARRGLRGVLTTSCPRGHVYDTENTRIGTKGERHCRSCERAWAKARRDRMRAAA